jgi:ABC-type Fe3+/spermidine/putrescine transport system ATPase subunit
MGVENFFDVSCVLRTAEATRFETATGLTLWAKDGYSARERAAATIAVRPESVKLMSDLPRSCDGPVNSVVGEVVEAIYEGGSRRWSIRSVTGERVMVRESNASDRPAVSEPARGSRVYLVWEPGKTLVYPRSASS